MMMLSFKRDHGISEAETMKRFWGENIDDPCLCGCGGKKVLSDDPKARTLAVETPCAQCKRPEAIRRYRYQTEVHSKLCKKCSRSNERVERTKFPCVGFAYKGVKADRSKNCLGDILLAPNEIKKRQRKAERNQNSFFDPSLGRSCENCTRALHNLLRIERRAKRILADKGQAKSEKIRNRKHLSRFLSENHLHITPQTFRPNVEKIRNRRRRQAPGVAIAHFIRRWSQPLNRLPTDVRMGLCLYCGKLAITATRVPKIHWLPRGDNCRCHWLQTTDGKNFNSLRRRGKKPSMPQSNVDLRVKLSVEGLSVTEGSLKISFAWTVQHYLYLRSQEKGKSYRAIAADYGVHESSVRGRVAEMIKSLPAPELVQRRWQMVIRLFLDAAKKEAAAVRLNS